MASVDTCKVPQQRQPCQARPNPVPVIEWTDRPTADFPFGVVRIQVGREVAHYDVCELADVQIDGCRGFHFAKHGDVETDYHVLIAPNPQDHSCECRGFHRWGYCRHVDAARFVAATPSPEVPLGQPGPGRPAQPLNRYVPVTPEAEAEQSRPIFESMPRADLVDLALGLLASEIRLRTELDDATSVIR